MRVEFPALRVPKVFPHVGGQFIPEYLPLCSLALRSGLPAQLDQVVEGQDIHRVVVDVDGVVGILVDLHAPAVLGLHIAPVGRRRTDDQAVGIIPLTLAQVGHRSFQPFQDGLPAPDGGQPGSVARPLHILGRRLDQGGFLVGLDRILVGGQLGPGPAVPVAVGHARRVRHRHETVRNVAFGPLEIQEGLQRIADFGRIDDLQGQGDEGIEVADPNLLISRSRIEARHGEGAGHRVHLRHQRVFQDPLQEQGLLIRRTGKRQYGRQQDKPAWSHGFRL